PVHCTHREHVAHLHHLGPLLSLRHGAETELVLSEPGIGQSSFPFPRNRERNVQRLYQGPWSIGADLRCFLLLDLPEDGGRGFPLALRHLDRTAAFHHPWVLSLSDQPQQLAGDPFRLSW